MKTPLIYSVLRIIARMSWLRLGIRNRIIKLFCDNNKIKDKPFVMDFYGYKYNGNFNCYIDWSAYFFGAYEKEDIQVLADLANATQAPVFFDIGANIGHHSLFMARLCDQVHSFEPYSVVREKLEEKLNINNRSNIHIHPVGLGEEDQELEFYAPQGSNTGTGSFVSSHEVDNNESIGKLKVVNSDEYVARLNLEKLDIIKIDVEGFEKSVLLGLKDTIAKYRPSLMVEYSEDTKDSFLNIDDLLSLFPEDYIIKRIRSDRNKYVIFNQPHYKLLDFDFERPGGNLLITTKDRML